MSRLRWRYESVFLGGDFVKNVSTNLLDSLLSASEGQTVAPFDPIGELYDRVKIIDNSYQKGHSVPEGYYKVKLLDIKCHNKTCYHMDIQILNESSSKEPYGTQPVISGYGSRYRSDFTDLANCFGDGTLLKNSKAYIGLCGEIHLTHSGWIELMAKLPPPLTTADENGVFWGT